MGFALKKRDVASESMSARGVLSGDVPTLPRGADESAVLQSSWLGHGGAAGERRLASVLVTPTGPNLSLEDKAAAECKFTAIEPLISPEKFGDLWLECGGKKGAVVDRVAGMHGVRRSSLYKWLKEFDRGGLAALVKKDRTDKGKPRSFNQAAIEFLLAATMPRRGEYGRLSVREIYRLYTEERAWRDAHAGKQLPKHEAEKYVRYLAEGDRLSESARLPEASYATFHRWYERIPSAVKVMARKGADVFSSTQDILSFRDIAAIQPMDYVVMDHRQLDLFCLSAVTGGWKLVRPWLTAAIDMRTRKWLAWVIVETPSSDSIATVLRKIFLEYGIPKAVYWDNGKDFRCEWLEGRDRRKSEAFRARGLHEGMRGVLETLNVRVHHAIVKRARSKIIEPNFVNTSNYDRTLPWWCGHKPTERPQQFGELIEKHERWLKGKEKKPAFEPISHISWLYDEFLRRDLNEREHTGEGMQKITPYGRGWMCPNECWEQKIGAVTRRWADPETLQFCFHKRREVTVRNGEVKMTLAGRHCHYRVPGDPTRLMALNGRTVEVGYDQNDAAVVALYHEQCFIGLAEDIELRMMGNPAFVQDERIRRAARREVRKLIAAVEGNVPVPSADERALRRAEVVPDREQPQRINVPCPIPDGVAAAVDAAKRDRDVPEEVEVTLIPSATERDDDDFNFFS